MRSHDNNSYQGSYNCTCDPGYESTEFNEHGASKCADINECDVSNSCPSNSYCSNLEGKYTIESIKGYFGILRWLWM